MRITLASLLVFTLACSEAPTEAPESAAIPAAAPSARRILAPAPFSADGPFSPGVQAGDRLWIAGMVGSDPATGEKAEGIEAQTRQAMENIGVVLKDAGLGFSNLVTCHVQLTDMDDYAAMNAVYASFFEEGKYPARTTLEMPSLVGGHEVEVSCIAHADSDAISYVRPDPAVIPAAMGPYSPGVRAGDMLFLSGQGGRDPQTGETPSDVAAQTTRTLQTIEATLDAAGLDFSNVLFTNVYYLGAANRGAVDAAYMERFQPGAAPSRGAFELSDLPGDISVEITFVAADDAYISRLHPYDVQPDETASPASLSGDVLYLSAVGGDGAVVEEQFRAALEEQKARLALAGLSLAHVVNANVYLSDVADFAAMNGVFREYFSTDPPARTTVGVNAPEGVRVQVALIASK